RIASSFLLNSRFIYIAEFGCKGILKSYKKKERAKLSAKAYLIPYYFNSWGCKFLVVICKAQSFDTNCGEPFVSKQRACPQTMSCIIFKIAITEYPAIIGLIFNKGGYPLIKEIADFIF